MASSEDILKIAAGEIGYYAPDDPEPGSKYGRWMAELTGEEWLSGPSTSVWWCMIFVSWVFAQANSEFPSYPSYNTDSTVSAARDNGSLINPRDAQPGDIVIFDWNKKTSATDHVGIVEKNYGTYIQTIEGNTSGSDWGSQSSGNGVHRRTRSWGSVAYVIRPDLSGFSYESESSNRIGDGDLIAVDGEWGSATTTKAQRVINAPYVDGVISRQTIANKQYLSGCTSGWEFLDGYTSGSQTISILQNKWNAHADGVIGKNTVEAMQSYYGTYADGYLDNPSPAIKAFQRALNNNVV